VLDATAAGAAAAPASRGLFQFPVPDVALLVVYGAFLLYVTARIFGPHRRDMTEYLVASRAVTLPGFVATLVSTWYGGILGVGEYSYRYGLSNWLVFGVPYYLWAGVFAIFLARRAHATRLFSLPDQLYQAYGRPTGVAGAALVFLTTLPAGYVLQLGTLFAVAFGWPLWFGVTLGTLFSVIYLFRGGLRSVVITERVQFVLMFAGFAVILPYLFAHHGGLAFLRAHTPASHWAWHGGNAPQYVLAWYVLAMNTLVEPAFYQRCYAAKSPAVARTGILIAIFCWMFFDFMTTTVGLYARAVLPHLGDPVQAYPALAGVELPSVALGLFTLGMLATVMSTVDSYAFVAAIALGRDLWWRLRGGEPERAVPRATRVGLFVTAALSVAVALQWRSVIAVWHDFGSVITPALLAPVLTSFDPRHRMRRRLALLALVGTAAVGAFWLYSGRLLGLPAGQRYLLGLEPVFPALAFAIAIFAADRALRARSRDARAA
jgi:SSS family solute:Na+ symporter